MRRLIQRLRSRRDALALAAYGAWTRLIGGRRFDARYFDLRFRIEDPWGFARREYERAKYKKTFEQISSATYRNILEVGCAEGLFTKELAPLAERVCAVDISKRALERARATLRDFDNVELRRVDIFQDRLDWSFDLVICSEVLCFAEDQTQLDEACRRLAAWVEPGGKLLLVHLRVAHEFESGWDAPDLRFGADSIHRRFAGVTGLSLESEAWEKDHAFALLRRRAS